MAGRQEANCLLPSSAGHLLYVQQGSHLLVDFGVVVVTDEGIRARALGEDRHRKTRVGVAGEVHAGLVVQNVSDGDGEGIVGAVEHVLLLRVVVGGGVGHGEFIGAAQSLHLVVRQHQTVALRAGELETKELFNVLHGVLKAGALFLVGGHILLVELGIGDGLARETIKIGVVVRAGVPSNLFRKKPVYLQDWNFYRMLKKLF